MNLEKYMLPCLSKTLFGIECLGCGFQRALFLLFQGDFKGAFEMYPALYTSLIFLGIVALYFFDKSRNYKNPLWFFGILNSAIMVLGYAYKHYY
ncbi:DUF2752 domain-containing protein [Flavobacterium branchiarum]|uniref:DUF2752 domain-containing protein n=1 Tax=Flavobacterium branchiarum TaxID=1114870 RepID=A0ABV5FHX9_9FLAO|nr:DUF2752 domain-containing protein [Flavobacterium branchiarum]MDN3673920.1 DUF2752 domain-containing protein [Flavobacterium branchiarum]